MLANTPYTCSGKLLKEKSFANFEILWLSAKNFSTKILFSTVIVFSPAKVFRCIAQSSLQGELLNGPRGGLLLVVGAVAPSHRTHYASFLSVSVANFTLHAAIAACDQLCIG